MTKTTRQKAFLIVASLGSVAAFAGLEKHSHLLWAFQAEGRAASDTSSGRPDLASSELNTAYNELQVAEDKNRGFGGHKKVAMDAVQAAQASLSQAQSIVGPALVNLQAAQNALRDAQAQYESANGQAQGLYQNALGQLGIAQRETENSAHFADGEPSRP